MSANLSTSRPQDTADAELDARLLGAWRTQQWCHGVYGLGHLLVVIGAAALGLLGLDWLIDLPGAVRTALLLALLGAGGWRAWQQAWRMLRRYKAQRVGLQIEKQYPQLNSLLVSYIDFTGSPIASGTSSQMRAHVCQQASAESRSLDFTRIAPHRSMRRGAAAIVTTIVVYVAASVAWPQTMSVFAERVINPFSLAMYPTDTQIRTVTGDVNIPEGGKVVLVAGTAGVQPTRGALRIRSDGVSWESIELVAQEDGMFGYTFREVFRGFQYEFRLGDARSRRHDVRVVHAPRIVKASVTIDPPDYTNLPTSEHASLTLTSPEGAVVRWRLELDRPVDQAALVAETGGPVAMEHSEDGKVVTAQMLAKASGAYHFRWRGEAHHFEYEGARHYLQVLLDRDPRVRIDYPIENEKGTLAKTLDIAFTARDDHGIAQATLVYRKNETQPVRRPVRAFERGKSVEQTLSLPLKELVDDMKEGDLITYHIEVTDQYPGVANGHRAVSEARRVQILSEADYQACITRRRQMLMGTLRPVYRQERLASQNLRDIRGAQP